MDTIRIGDTVELRHSGESTRGKVTKLIANDRAAVLWATRTGHEGRTTVEQIANLRRVSG